MPPFRSMPLSDDHQKQEAKPVAMKKLDATSSQQLDNSGAVCRKPRRSTRSSEQFP